jgi:hypothetical protein
VVLAAIAIATVLTTQGCDSGPATQASAPAHPDVTLAQARAAYQTIVTTSESAAAQGNATAGLSMVADASWAFAHTQYTALASAGTPVIRYEYGTPTYYVPEVSGYPHWFVVDVPRRTADTNNVDTLMAFGQSNRNSSWTLDGETALQPGQTMPAIATNSKGYALSLSPYQQGLLLQPNLVGGTQAAVVDEGAANPASVLVTPGPQTTDLYNQYIAASNATPKDLSYIWYMGGSNFPVFALQTANGGALVLYGMYLNTTTEYPDNGAGAPIPVPSNFRPLLADPTAVADHVVDANWTYEFATIDPSASVAKGQIKVIAATGFPTYGKAY